MKKAGFLYLLAALVSVMAGYLLFQQRYAPKTAIPATDAKGSDREIPLADMLRPDFSLPDLEGRLRGPAEWNEKVLILNFWASWCPPCLKEIPAFIRLQHKYAGREVQFVGIALQSADEIREFVIAQGITYPILVGAEEVIRVAEQYGNHTGGLPYTVFVDREQHIAFIKHGPLTEDEADSVINSLLASK